MAFSHSSFHFSLFSGTQNNRSMRYRIYSVKDRIQHANALSVLKRCLILPYKKLSCQRESLCSVLNPRLWSGISYIKGGILCRESILCVIYFPMRGSALVPYGPRDRRGRDRRGLGHDHRDHRDRGQDHQALRGQDHQALLGHDRRDLGHDRQDRDRPDLRDTDTDIYCLTTTARSKTSAHRQTADGLCVWN